MKNNRFINQSGQSMFEVILALFIIVMIIVAVVILSTTSISNSLFAKNKTQASRYSQEAVEWLRKERETNSSSFNIATDTSTYCLNSNPPNFSNIGTCSSTEVIANTIFYRDLSLSKTSISNKSITTATVVVWWEDSKGHHEARTVTNFTDIRER